MPVPRSEDPAAAMVSDGRREIDPINALVMGGYGSYPQTVQLASQKIPADPPPNTEVIPLPAPVPMNIEPPGVQEPEPIMEHPMGFFARLLAGPLEAGPDRGIAYERVAYAPFVIDVTSPMTQWAIQIEAANDFRHPDLAEYIFAAPSSGPPTQRSINYQDYNFIGEMGNSAFSVKAIMPVRCVDPDTGGSTAGLGDAEVEIKLVPLSGERWKIAGCLDFDIPSGAASRGMGRGFLALEPGLLASLRWTDATYLHAEMKYLIPIPLAPGVAGTILTWGVGVSHVLYDADAFAIIPTAEFVCYSIFDASETLLTPAPVTNQIGDLTVPTINLGFRLVSDRFRDLGTVEWGVSLGINLSSSNWWAEMARTELRVMY